MASGLCSSVHPCRTAAFARLLKFQVCGSTLAVFADDARPKAELRIELAGATLLESSSQGKLRSKKDDIFRWKVTIAGVIPSTLDSESVVDGGPQPEPELSSIPPV